MTADYKKSAGKRELLSLFEQQVKDIRQQLGEQLRCLDGRLEAQLSLVSELQEYFRRRAEVELEHSRALDKMARALAGRPRAAGAEAERLSAHGCWEQLVANARRQGRDHAALAEVFGAVLVAQLAHLLEDVQRIHRKCRTIGLQQHDELLKVLHELQAAMRTYHGYRASEEQARAKLELVEAQKRRLEASVGREKLERSRRFRVLTKELAKRAAKHRQSRLQGLKARNEYLLALGAANAAVHKYFAEDLSDLIDCMDFGFHVCLSRVLRTSCSAEECLQRSLQQGCQALAQRIADLDSRADKQRFLEGHHSAFMVPRRFAFQPHRADAEPVQVSVAEQPLLEEELAQRLGQLSRRLSSVCTENEETWKTLETAEGSLLAMMAAREADCRPAFLEGPRPPPQPETLALKLRADKQETEDFYLEKFRAYSLGCSVAARLEAKAELLRAALQHRAPPSEEPPRPPSQARKKRIGRQALRYHHGPGAQPRLFEGSLEEYLEATNQEVPLVIRSCVRVINLYGLHHQGVFRVSGSQVEINHFRDCFERGEDPLAEVSDASDINSVAGVLKLYLRELREPLFPIFYFDQLMEISHGLSSEPDISLFGRSDVLEARAQYDFAARSERELSFRRGDRLQLYSQVSADWWRGHFGGRDGLVPDKYILLSIRETDQGSTAEWPSLQGQRQLCVGVDATVADEPSCGVPQARPVQTIDALCSSPPTWRHSRGTCRPSGTSPSSCSEVYVICTPLGAGMVVSLSRSMTSQV
ncbi:SLIT-ROBO Rho GTPase-activating protein 2B-like isoform X8 [Haemaphysalis longicornis]